MKHVRHLLVAAMTVFLAAVLALPAFAAESYPITINNPNATNTHTYTAYQVFSGTLSKNENNEDVLANIDWGKGVNGDALLAELQTKTAYADCANAQDVADVLTSFGDNSTEIEAFVDIVGKHLTTGKASTASADKKTYTIDPGEVGYYIVKETGDNPETNRSASGYMIKVVGPTEMNVKDQPMTPDKSILQNGTTKVKEGTANVGDDVQFVVDTIKVPNVDGYTSFKFVMKDTLPKGLTFKSIDSVKVGTTTFTEDAAVNGYTFTTTVNDTDGTTELRIAFIDALNMCKALEGQTVEIKYTATVNKDANFGNTGNENEVVFEFTNKPDQASDGEPDFGPDEPHGTTPESNTTTYVTKIQLLKVDGEGENPNPVANAVFDLAGEAKNVVVTTGTHFVEAENGTYYLLKDGTYTETAPTTATADKYKSTEVKYELASYSRTELDGAEDVDIVGVASGEDGKITFEGLKPGTYTLTETGAPEGYNKIDDPISFTIKFVEGDTYGEGAFAFDGEAPDGVTLLDDGTFMVTVVNKAGTTLPETGGMGTTILYIVGGCMIAAGVVMFLTKRRMANLEQ